jgi:hypothetical protein
MDSTRRRIAAGLLLAALAALGTGCASSAVPPTQGTATPTTSAAANWPTQPALSGQPVVLDEHANSTTVHVRVGTTVKLLLHSSYWDIAGSSSPSVLAPQGAPTQVPVTPTCPPGVGCNPVRAMFSALSPGESVLSASRTSCGEALRCGTENGHFQVTVIVTQ